MEEVGWILRDGVLRLVAVHVPIKRSLMRKDDVAPRFVSLLDVGLVLQDLGVVICLEVVEFRSHVAKNKHKQSRQVTETQPSTLNPDARA